ncbi:hypothetical protein BDQ12DRAFT_661797 [Crucibulum laeve]|uniref:Cyclin N-terminal domain-containing protein n=1 Tax=Crucibulum laeve TaxID=68775 RepID=A0A5C3MEK0_9AGAR|nr:hypothetical protein BDQ12DRAFT_661797 [Crucibulum laeve]
MSDASGHPIRHPHSLIPISDHHPGLIQLMNSRISLKMISFVAHTASKVIRIQGESHFGADMGLPTPPPTPLKPSFNAPNSTSQIISLQEFILHLVRTSHLNVASLLTTVVYLERLKTRLSCFALGLPCTRHRVFLAILIVSCKYLHDSGPRNVHWEKYAVAFDLAEINLMERQMLHLLDFDLRFNEKEACEVLAPLMPGPPTTVRQLPPTPSYEAPAHSSSSFVSPASSVSAKHMPTSASSASLTVSTTKPASVVYSNRHSTDILSASTSGSSTNSYCISSPYWPANISNMRSSASGSSFSSLEDDPDVYTSTAKDSRPFVLKPVPSRAYRHSKERVSASSQNIAVLKNDALTPIRYNPTTAAYAPTRPLLPRLIYGSPASQYEPSSLRPQLERRAASYGRAPTPAHEPPHVERRKLHGGFIGRLINKAAAAKSPKSSGSRGDKENTSSNTQQPKEDHVCDRVQQQTPKKQSQLFQQQSQTQTLMDVNLNVNVVYTERLSRVIDLGNGRPSAAKNSSSDRKGRNFSRGTSLEVGDAYN